MIEELIAIHGEQFRCLITDAVSFLEGFAQKHSIELDIPEVITDLVREAHVTPIPEDIAKST